MQVFTDLYPAEHTVPNKYIIIYLFIYLFFIYSGLFYFDADPSGRAA
jgi:hypothetical protein